MRTFDVVVPRPGTRADGWIAPGSGIVAVPFDADPEHRVEVYFEGNLYGAANIVTFDDKVKHAAGRLAQQYPTIAAAVYPREDFDVVGSFSFAEDWSTHRLEITDAETLARWTGPR